MRAQARAKRVSVGVSVSEYENECMREGMCDVHVRISKCMKR